MAGEGARYPALVQQALAEYEAYMAMRGAYADPAVPLPPHMLATLAAWARFAARLAGAEA